MANDSTTEDKIKELQDRYLRVGDGAWAEMRLEKGQALSAMRAYLSEAGFVEVEPTPSMATLTGACENLETLWGPYDYYGGGSFFLAQTGQPLLELLIGKQTPRVYAVNQSYRKETTQFGRRLACFNMLEVEVLDGTLDTLRSILRGMIERVKPSNHAWPVITYTEAVNVLRLQTHSTIEWGDDLKAEHELYLTKDGPVFITEYPRKLKFFNAAPLDDSAGQELTQSMDLLLPGVGEAAGCTVREHRPHILARQLQEYAYDPKRREDVKLLGLDGPEGLIDAYSWYILKKSVPHAGFGIGVARLWQYLFGAGNITDVCEFPRIKGVLLP